MQKFRKKWHHFFPFHGSDFILHVFRSNWKYYHYGVTWKLSGAFFLKNHKKSSFQESDIIFQGITKSDSREKWSELEKYFECRQNIFFRKNSLFILWEISWRVKLETSIMNEISCRCSFSKLGQRFKSLSLRWALQVYVSTWEWSLIMCFCP